MTIFLHILYISMAVYGLGSPIIQHTSSFMSAVYYKVIPFFLGLGALFAELVLLGFMVSL